MSIIFAKTFDNGDFDATIAQSVWYRNLASRREGAMESRNHAEFTFDRPATTGRRGRVLPRPGNRNRVRARGRPHDRILTGK